MTQMLERLNTRVVALQPECDPGAAERRSRTLDILQETPGLRYALVFDHLSSPETVIVAMAIRMVEIQTIASFELRIPSESFDEILFLDSIKHARVH